MKKKAIYPGSFDPITKGHLDIIDRAGDIFPELIIAVSDRANKNFTFSLEERVDMVKAAMGNRGGVEILSFDNLLVDLALSLKSFVIIRGLRAISDFEYEFQLALMNRSLNSNIETLFLMPDEKYTYLSSGLIKEIASLKGDVSDFMPAEIIEKVIEKLQKK